MAGTDCPIGSRARLILALPLGAVLVAWPVVSEAITATPTPTITGAPTPQRTGDLGTRQIAGHVYDARGAGDLPLGGATVSYWAPADSGTVQADAAGAFTFALFLHDTDLITIAAAADGFNTAELRVTGLELWLGSSFDIRLVPVEPGTHRVAGVVHRDRYCGPDARIVVELASADGGGAVTMTLPPSDAFEFAGVRDGDYLLSAVSECQPSYYAPVPISVRGADVSADLSADLCPPGLVLDPTHGPAGMTVAVIGRCYYIHSGGAARVYLDGEFVVEVRANTGGDYQAEIRLPDDSAAGFHDVSVTTVSGTPIGSARVYVNPPAIAPCAGDCDRDGAVTVDELVAMVSLALGAGPGARRCPAAVADGIGPPRVDDLVAAVNSALDGCGGQQAGVCYESADCAPYEFGPHMQFAAGRGWCCQLWSGGSLPFTFCPADAYDPFTGECTQCVNPC